MNNYYYKVGYSEATLKECSKDEFEYYHDFYMMVIGNVYFSTNDPAMLKDLKSNLTDNKENK